MKENKKMGSFCVHELQDNRTTKPHQLPIYATSSFEFENIDQGMDIFSGKTKGHVYSRYGNPTIEVVAEKIARLEAFGLDLDPKGMLFSSGMSAISTLMMATLEKGDKILSQGNLYGGTTELFTKIFSSFGIDLIMMDLHDLDKVAETIKADPGIKMLYFETPANPSMACVDIQGLADIAQKYGRYSAIDNTFCTPYLQQPFKYGVDFIIHSTTKYLNGHGNSIAGAIIGKDRELMETKIWQAMKLVGTNCNPWDAWLINNGIKTLELRMDRHSANAQLVAEYLEQHPKVIKTNYPGLASHPDHEIAKKQMAAFGGMLSFEIDGGLEPGIGFMNKIELCVLAPTLGDVDTLILHPASMSHMNIPREVRLSNGITDGLIRMSIGIENVEDIISDLENALK
ncbi:MAG: methionine-gamma-lyase [Saprospiraceae bacterium]|jgi:methionine-gamma-lyase